MTERVRTLVVRLKAGLQDLYGPRLRGDQSRSELFDVVARLGQP